MADEPIYTIQPVPKWYIANNLGLPLAPNGYIFTYRSLNKTSFKYAFKDPAGEFPWTDPIPVDANGTVGPIYWEFDPANPDETYYIRVCKSNDPDDLLWDFDGLSGASGSGGSTITTALDLENLISNNTFYRNSGTISSLSTFNKVAPGAHTGLAKTASNRGPDICFIKNNTAAIDTISFPSLFGAAYFAPDATPPVCFNYTCSNNPLGETSKYLLFPITSNVQNLSAQSVSFTMYGNLGAAGAADISVSLVQFFGDGVGASSEVSTPVASITVDSNWTKYGPYTVAIPNVSGKTLGGCQNDGIFLKINFPLGLACNINIAKPSLYLTPTTGAVTPTIEYRTNDTIEAEINDFRTGDIRTSLNDYAPFGWVPMDDGSIGNPSSGATTRASFDTFPLYNQIWNSVSNSYAPVVGGRGSTAVEDFVANKAISLTRALGRVFAGTLNTQISQTFTVNYLSSTSLLNVASATGFFTGVPIVLSNTGGSLPTGLTAGITYYAIFVSTTTIRLATTLANAIAGTSVTFSSNGTGTHTVTVTPYQLGQPSGSETYQLQSNDLPPHVHPAAGGGQFLTTSASTFNFEPGLLGSTKETNTGSNATSNNPISLVQPTTYMNVYIKL